MSRAPRAPRALRVSRAPRIAFALTLLATTVLGHPELSDEAPLSDEEYYRMPQLFQLDHYERCLSQRHLYCVGSFELSGHAGHELMQLMKRHSSHWVTNYNHTRLHRALCVSRRCPRDHAPSDHAPRDHASTDHVPFDHAVIADTFSEESPEAWFSSCVNASMMSSYNLSARLYHLDYCERAPNATSTTSTTGTTSTTSTTSEPLSASVRAFAALMAALVALSAVSTALDLTLPEHNKKKVSWALSWSLPGCWGALQARPGGSAAALAPLDGLRVLGLVAVIVAHVCWLDSATYIVNTRNAEQMRTQVEGTLVTNGTLLVAAFFVLSAFLLANKLLHQQRRREPLRPIATFFDTMFNRIVRTSPSYFVVVWFAASWWERLGAGPLWRPLVGAEAAACRRLWWTHLLYVNNVLNVHDKCLIQTWYLAADMQLYVCALVVTLWLRGAGRRALAVLGAALAASVLAVSAVAYGWDLLPNYMLHNPETIRAVYSGAHTMHALYQAPLGNAPSCLAGLLLAHAHHALLDHKPPAADYKWFRWSSWWAPWAAVGWVVFPPRVAGDAGPVLRAVLAGLERPVLALLIAWGLLGAMHGVQSPVRRVLSWRGWAVPARLSFGALLLHMPVNKALIALRRSLTQFDQNTIVTEWFGVAVWSYMLALPLALLVELPAQRLQRALRGDRARPAPASGGPTQGNNDEKH